MALSYFSQEALPMFGLRETINTYDLALALKGQYGQFHVTTPDGGEMLVTCKPGHSISNVEWIGNEPKPFTVTKVSEPANITNNGNEVPTLRRTG